MFGMVVMSKTVSQITVDILLIIHQEQLYNLPLTQQLRNYGLGLMVLTTIAAIPQQAQTQALHFLGLLGTPH